MDLRRFAGTQADLLPRWEKTLSDLQANGLAERRDGTWALTRQGRNFADFVAYELINV